MAPTSGRTCGRSGGKAIGLRQDGSPEASAMCFGVAKQAQGSHLTQMPHGLHIQRIVQYNPANPTHSPLIDPPPRPVTDEPTSPRTPPCRKQAPFLGPPGAPAGRLQGNLWKPPHGRPLEAPP
ncbi:hypothetical protein PtB15_15B502 [Puccinia triticina]|nr:hypothetical protein PtB15_15B502 [Puccinia triticina]